ncbi:predicted protein [Histoplasma capsulatum var. duboisii H88]|uniref:Predicted protein n=1 Tax=Ajellomyces capsulatus (strain H88) TaxID=544711 RepID=F0U642_AJEC8|nr:predicted protein [Histoplasma capsulatum var. duboisii H88]
MSTVHTMLCQVSAASEVIYQTYEMLYRELGGGKLESRVKLHAGDTKS